LKDRRITLQEWRLRDKKFHLTLAQNANYISIEIEWLDYEERSLGFWIRELEMIRSTVHMINDPQKLIDRVLIGMSFAAFPIIIEGRVWGLFEGHHMSPHIAGRNMREAMALFSEFLSYQIRLIEMKR